ncbi:hypothetical protein ACFYZ4_03640 [Streptomyces sp. NPDC001513]|uniref:hypothetical protein n=1 Tax=Streptomyces sp. NPDC001513 TaxID=3364580 RepID=UPI0036A0D690
MIRREFAQEPDFRARFEHEVRSARRVQGYHIVPAVFQLIGCTAQALHSVHADAHPRAPPTPRPIGWKDQELAMGLSDVKSSTPFGKSKGGEPGHGQDRRRRAASSGAGYSRTDE